MKNNNDLGKEGEALARGFLDDQGYQIIATNWRVGHLEADIIALKDDRVVFVEVKTRTSEEYGEPEGFVDRKKQRAYIRLANAFMLRNGRYEEARFDIISVVIGKNGHTIRHIPSAFTTVG